ncbi:MAG: hypothetical protein KF740_15080 [Ramlibacter sp.]|nr:hypothetical protein [Ramlibacter sp.]
MKRAQRLALVAAVTAAALFGAAWLGLSAWVPNDEALARRIEAEAQQRLGVPVVVGAAHWRLLPQPVIEALDIRTQQDRPITIGRVALYPRLWRLLADRVFVAKRAELEHATFSRSAMAAFRGRANVAQAPGADFQLGPVPLERFVFRDVTWVSHSGVPVVYDGDIDFDPAWRPRRATLSRPGAQTPASLTLLRDGEADRWQVRVDVGGGTANGQVALTESPGGALTLAGELAPRNIEVASTLTTFNRRASLSGRVSGRTVLQAGGDSVGELARSLRTESDLTVANAVVLRLDLDKAIATRGQEREGQTPLDSLTGHLQTQNTEHGTRFTYTDVKARAGKYTASGEAVVWQKRVDAHGTLDIVDGLVGVPFTVSGPVQKPEVKVPPGFFAGAAIGTAVLPGVGTVIGARIGGALGRVFGGGDQRQ